MALAAGGGDTYVAKFRETDPFRQMDLLLDEVGGSSSAAYRISRRSGYSTAACTGLEETGMGYACEVEMIAKARATC